MINFTTFLSPNILTLRFICLFCMLLYIFLFIGAFYHMNIGYFVRKLLVMMPTRLLWLRLRLKGIKDKVDL